MSDAQRPLKLFATLLLFWMILNGSLAPDVFLAGLAISAAIAFLLPGGLSVLCGARLSLRGVGAALGFTGFFLRELVVANLRMAGLVLNPALPVRPAIVRVETRLTDPVARLLLANAITLTPGTLSVELSGRWLYVHWVVAETTDPQEATRAIVAGFENYLEVIYG